MENENGANPPNNNDVPPAIFSCDQCGKEFPTSRAMLGHRICHFRKPKASVAPPPPPPLEEEAPAGLRRVLALSRPGPNPPSAPAKGKRGRGPTKPSVVSSSEAHSVSDANVNEMFNRLTQLIKFVSNSGDPSSSSKRLKPDYHLARGLSYDEATDTVSFPRRALLIREGGDPSNVFVDREADDHTHGDKEGGGEGKGEGEGERKGGGEGEEDGGGGGGGVVDSAAAAGGGDVVDGAGGGVRDGDSGGNQSNTISSNDRSGGDDGSGSSGAGSRIDFDLNEPYVPENDD